MNRLFDFKRFAYFCKYNFSINKYQYLWIALILTIPSLFYLQSRAMSSASYDHSIFEGLLFIPFLIIMFAPCVLESKKFTVSPVLNLCIPVSTFERFLHHVLKYLIFIPSICFFIVGFCTLFSNWINLDDIVPTKEGGYVYGGTKLSSISLSLLACLIYLIGYSYFRKNPFTKTCLTLIAIAWLFPIVLGETEFTDIFPMFNIDNYLFPASYIKGLGMEVSSTIVLVELFFRILLPSGLLYVLYLTMKKVEA